MYKSCIEVFGDSAARLMDNLVVNGSVSRSSGRSQCAGEVNFVTYSKQEVLDAKLGTERHPLFCGFFCGS